MHGISPISGDRHSVGCTGGGGGVAGVTGVAGSCDGGGVAGSGGARVSETRVHTGVSNR
jgi:hypothetical protein